ncbi:protease Do-like 5, chloroplastic isoform X2 [Amborella trichopoda]|uniref:protease Do-like 5, chloroplastic isoform X2 n=1 Tax=Amborella trichopoda TaxID=13333 RepID=UPI0009BDBD82|nr:protease Do-like 5, chloroplastic isoform X2 [Amborella trichopoda]|eukprot:XP_020518604.1 protease Do-like 5, chloroplastic isoform X2 [Amborella trichopoda]
MAGVVPRLVICSNSRPSLSFISKLSRETRNLCHFSMRRFTIAGIALLPLIFSYYPLENYSRAKVDELEEDEERSVRLFQDTTASVVSIQNVEVSNPKNGDQSSLNKDENERVEGTGSGFVWDKMGHIVTNYHVVSKLATDSEGLQRCKVFLLDEDAKVIVKEGKLIGFDAAYDLAVLKVFMLTVEFGQVDVDGDELKPALIGSSHDLRVGQRCLAIGNPFGYEHTLTTGVVSGLGREIPSPSGRPIRGAIQTDAAINAGNSGGPLIDSYGHVIGVNTATFTRRGTGMSSGVNFAIPIDLVRQTVPYLIVYGTSLSNRY